MVLTANAAKGQTIIKGTVLDVQGQPIPGANIMVADSYDGTTSDEKGQFRFSTEVQGAHSLLVKFVGYRQHAQTLELNGKEISVLIKLQEQINELQAVTITAGSFTASDESRRTVFRAVDIATTAGATADIAGALNTLPGTQKVGESGRLFVRGGEGNETRTFIDGLVVLDSYGPAAPNTPSRGRFLPFMFKGTSFSTGGYTAEYGQALSSALVLDSRDESDVSRTDIGILSVGADVAHTQAWETGSAAAKLQYTDIRPYVGLIDQEIDWHKAPVSFEGVIALRQRTSRGGMFKVYGNFNNSTFALFNHDIDNYSQKSLYDLSNRYRYINSSYKETLSDKWMFRSGLSYTYINDEISIENHDIQKEESGAHAKAVVEGTLSESVELKTGLEIIARKFGETGNALNSAFSESVTSSFMEADVYLSNKLMMRAGGRVEYNSLNAEVSIDPRVSVAYETHTNGQVSFAYGTFRQTVPNDYVKDNQDLSSEKARHLILNYQYAISNRTFRVEAYHKLYRDLIKIGNGSATNDGKGYARGVEVFFRDNGSVKRLDYWISYSLLDTRRNYLSFPYSSVPAFASKHNFSVVGKYFVQRIKSQLGATFSYTSGRPYNDPNRPRFNDSKTPSYQDLSFNWSYLPRPHLIVYFSCTNILGRDNIFGYQFGNVLNENGVYNARAIRQPAPRFIFLGVFITISKNKSINQLPSL